MASSSKDWVSDQGGDPSARGALNKAAGKLAGATSAPGGKSLGAAVGGGADVAGKALDVVANKGAYNYKGERVGVGEGLAEAVGEGLGEKGGTYLGAMASAGVGTAIGARVGKWIGGRAGSNLWRLGVAAAICVCVAVLVLVSGVPAIPSPEAMYEPAVAADVVPEDYMTSYTDAVRFTDPQVPWSILAAIGTITTDNGRSSPYDQIDRTVAPNTIAPGVEPPIRGRGEGPLLLIPDESAPEVTIPTGPPVTEPTKTSAALPAGTVDASGWQPIAAVTTTTLPDPDPPKGPNPDQIDTQAIDDSADFLAVLMSDYADELADARGVDVEDMASDAFGSVDNAQFWIDVIRKMPIAFGGADDDCATPPGTPIPAAISIIWQCTGAAKLKDLVMVTGPGDLVWNPTTKTYTPGPQTTVTGQAALDRLVAEALTAAWSYSGWGSAPCDPKAAEAGVFPLTSGGATRCDPYWNIQNAAQIVIGRESQPLAARGGDTVSQAAYAWRGVPYVLSADGFLTKGFAARATIPSQCASQVYRAAAKMPANGDWSAYDPADRSRDAQLETAWQATPVVTEAAKTAECAPFAEHDPEWRHAVATALLAGTTGGESAYDTATTTTTAPGPTTTSTTTPYSSPPKNSNMRGLAGWLARDPITVSPQPGVTSLVDRLSNPQVRSTTPPTPAVGRDYYLRQIIRTAAAFVDAENPFGDDAEIGLNGVPMIAAQAYQQAAGYAARVVPGCRIQSSLIAGVGAVETGHGTQAGSQIVAGGTLSPPILGPALDGRSGTARPDTDNGKYDTDNTWDREFGITRLLTSKFSANESDGNNDGRIDAQNVFDDAATTAVLMCRAVPGKAMAIESEQRTAIAALRPGKAYADKVLAAAASIQGASTGGGDYAPVNGGAGAPELVRVQGFTVNKSWADQIDKMITAMKAAGLNPTGGAYRSPEQQVNTRRNNCGPTYYDIYEKPSSECKPPTAKPGSSMHEQGLAIDFSNCPKGSALYNWLTANARNYGVYNFPKESWHWSSNGK